MWLHHYICFLLSIFIVTKNISGKCLRAAINEIVECEKTNITEIHSMENAENIEQLTILFGTIPTCDNEKPINLPKLRILKIHHANSPEIDQKAMFSNLSQLKELSLLQDNIISIHSTTFSNLKQLQKLDLRYNKLKLLHTNTFKYLTELTKLDLSHNELKKLNKGIFDNLIQLKSLIVDRNQITFIEQNILQYNQQLEIIFLNDNKLTTLNPDVFALSKYMFSFSSFHSPVTKLNLSHNNFPTLNALFSQLTHLIELQLKGCQIANFESDTIFKSNVRLEILDLSYNKIKTFRADVLNPLIKLRKLYLDECGLETLPLNLTLTNLEVLSVRRNNLRRIDGNVFKFLNNLKMLYIPLNNINFLESTDFIYLTGLRMLNLRLNNIKSISIGVFDHLINLHTLDLLYCNISTIDSNAFFKMKGLTELILSGNNLNYINYGLFDSLHDGQINSNSRLQKLEIINNNITNLKSYAFTQLILLNNLNLCLNNLKFLDQDVFKKAIKLESLSLKGNKIENLEGGIFDSLKNLIELDLSNNLLTDISYGLFDELSHLEILKLSGNKLKTITPQVINLPELRILHLDRNEINYLSPDLLASETSSIKHLNIIGNKLSYLDNDFLMNSKLDEINIEYNPWQCSCLDQIMNTLHYLKISFQKNKYFDGKVPLCIVHTESCLQYSEMSEELYKNYTSSVSPNLIPYTSDNCIGI